MAKQSKGDDAIKQHQTMARGSAIEGEADNFGIEPFSSTTNGKPMPMVADKGKVKMGGVCRSL